MDLVDSLINVPYQAQQALWGLWHIKVRPGDALNLDDLAWGPARLVHMAKHERPLDVTFVTGRLGLESLFWLVAKVKTSGVRSIRLVFLDAGDGNLLQSQSTIRALGPVIATLE
jgi:hypothetical protein